MMVMIKTEPKTAPILYMERALIRRGRFFVVCGCAEKRKKVGKCRRRGGGERGGYGGTEKKEKEKVGRPS
jgi:hypothetical protein